MKRMAKLTSMLGKYQGQGLIAGLASKIRTPEDVKTIMDRLADGLYKIKGKPVTEREVKDIQHKYAMLFYEQRVPEEVKKALENYFITPR